MGGILYFISQHLLTAADALIDAVTAAPLYAYSMIVILLLAIFVVSANVFMLQPVNYRLGRYAVRRRNLVAPLLWVSVAYLLFRFPLTAFVALGPHLGRSILMLLMYSFLFIPAWGGFALLLVRTIRRARHEPREWWDDQPRRSSWLLLALLIWGLIGELRLLADPALHLAITRISQ